MIVIEQLIAQNVRDFFLAPGSRSTPLALAAARSPNARLHRHFDERGLGFFAMGCALGKQTPTAIIVTSGTATGNLTPAIMEAYHASIPLIVLTADRPQELLDVSANQATDQTKMFQNFVRWQCEIDLSMPTQAISSKVAQAVFRSQFPHPGPVHINCPFREPLYDPSSTSTPAHPIVLKTPLFTPTSPISLPSRGLCLIGRLPKPSDLDAVLDFAKRAQWPVFADLLSNARLSASEELIRHYDFRFWSHPPKPDCIVHFGERFTSKRLLEWCTAHPPKEYIHVSPHSSWVDPSALITQRIAADVALTAQTLTATPDPTWLPLWKESDHLPPIDATFTETSAIRTISNLPFENWAFFLGNSMPIREADWFLFPKKARGFFANRGLSGIDGNIATIGGLSIGLNAPVIGILGDVTALHDLNSMAVLKSSPNPIILLISNNQGCGIFSHLPVAKDPHFDQLFGFSHELHFEHAARLFELSYASASTQDELELALRDALQSKASSIIEMKTSRVLNHAHHAQMKQACV